MKKLLLLYLICMGFSLLLSGCRSIGGQNETSQTVQIANPWSDWASIEEAENAAGFAFGLPEVIAGTYTAENFRTMNNELIEVIYRDGDHEVRVRKLKGEEQDISGDYTKYDSFSEIICNGAVVSTYYNSGNSTLKQTLSHQGYSWSLVATNGYWGDSNIEFLELICK